MLQNQIRKLPLVTTGGLQGRELVTEGCVWRKLYIALSFYIFMCHIIRQTYHETNEA